MEKNEIDRKIIDLIQNYDFIYRKESPGYKDPIKKRNAFAEMARELSLESGEQNVLVETRKFIYPDLLAL